MELFAGLGLLSHALSCVLVIPCPKDQEKFTEVSDLVIPMQFGHTNLMLQLVLNGLKFEKYVELLNELNMDSTLLGNQQVSINWRLHGHATTYICLGEGVDIHIPGSH